MSGRVFLYKLDPNSSEYRFAENRDVNHNYIVEGEELVLFKADVKQEKEYLKKNGPIAIARDEYYKTRDRIAEINAAIEERNEAKNNRELSWMPEDAQ